MHSISKTGRTYSLILGLVVILLFTGASSVTRSKVVSTYEGQIGVRELTGANDGPAVEKYLASCGLKKGHAWCAAFLNYVHATAGAKHNNNAWAPSWVSQHVVWQRGKQNEYTPQQGDVFGIYFPAMKRVGHVGFIDHWEDKVVITVEGNTNDAGSREGDGVYRKRRLAKQIYKVSNWID